MRKLFISLGVSLIALPAMAQTTVTVPMGTTSQSLGLASSVAENNPDFCINKMAEFPTDNHEARYQFFRLTQEFARGATPELRSAIIAHSDGPISEDTSILDSVETIANPVLRQAAPDVTLSHINYVFDFAIICEPFITGQVDSLTAFDASLSDAEFNAVIAEDALFLRQILSDALMRQGADQDPMHASATLTYASDLITTRDAIEFATFESDIDELEALYMEDLDGRLKRSNDMINSEMDREILGDSVALSDSMNKAAKEKAKQQRIYVLVRILGGGY